MIERAETERFVKVLFGQATEYDGQAFVSSLLNDNKGGERKLLTRDIGRLLEHAQRWDVADRGCYIVVNLLRPGERVKNKDAVGLIVTVHADTDFKTIGLDQDEALARILALPCPPTMVVASGGGLHPYWLLTDPLQATPENVEIIEGLNGVAADTIGGDTQARDVSRLLRLPGTHNTKEGAWTPVRIVHLDEDRLYDLETLQDWLAVQSPVIHRIAKPKEGSTSSAVTAENPWLAAAKLLGFKPPIDVEEMLSAMAYQGGENSIHETQLRVSAALLGRGVETEEVVETLLEATRAAAGEFGSRWNWRREENNLRRMCADWLKKHPEILERQENGAAADEATSNPFSQYGESVGEEEPARANGTNGASSGATVVQLSERRQKKEKTPKAKKPKDDSKFVTVGQVTIEVLVKRNEPLLIYRGIIWQYRDGVWHPQSEELEHALKVEIQRTCAELDITPTPGILNGAWRYVTERPELVKNDITWDPPHLIPCSDAVIERDSLHARPAAPDDYLRWKLAVPTGTDPKPVRFVQFLWDVLQDYSEEERLAIIGVIQEWLGLALCRGKPRELRKGLLIYGPSRTGKSQFASIVRALFGEKVCGQALRSLSERFGYQALWGAHAWIADDAIGTAEDLDDERYKVVVTGEPVTIERKFMAPVEHRFDIPVLFTANNLPRVKDISEAVYNRTLPIAFTHIFDEDEVKGGGSIADQIIAEELSSILLWALAGLQRALARGRFDLPAVIRRQIEDFKQDNNPVAAWAQHAITREQHRAVDRRDLLTSFNQWLKDMYGDEARSWGGKSFFRHMRLICPWANFDSAIKGSRRVAGLMLTDAGLDYVDDAKDQNPARTVGSGRQRTDINQFVKVDPNDRPKTVF